MTQLEPAAAALGVLTLAAATAGCANKYQYVQGHADTVRLQLKGGSMGGGRVRSDEVVVVIP